MKKPSSKFAFKLSLYRYHEGWRHFEAVGKSPADKANGKPEALVHLAATCDRDITVWVRNIFTFSNNFEHGAHFFAATNYDDGDTLTN